MVPVDGIYPSAYKALDKVCQEAMKLRGRVSRPCKATTSERAGPQAKVTTVLLRNNVSREFAGAKNAVLALIDAHRFIYATRGVRVRWIQLPASLEFNGRQRIRSITINLVCRRIN